MSHNDLFFRYACKESLNKHEVEIINSQLAFNIENIKKCEEIELAHDLLNSLTDQDQKEHLNSPVTIKRFFDESLRKKTVLLRSNILMFLVAEKEQLNKLGKKLFKFNLRLNRCFSVELQEYVLFNKQLHEALKDTDCLDLQRKLDVLQENYLDADTISNENTNVNTEKNLDTALESKKIYSNENASSIIDCIHQDANLEVDKSNSIQKRVFEIGKWKKVAASVTLLVGLSATLYFGQQKATQNALYNTYYESYKLKNFEKDAPDVLLNTAFYNYHQGNYKGAKDIFYSLSKNSEYKTTASFYLGLSNMELNLFDEAINCFIDESLVKSEYKYMSQWYLALCFIKTKENTMAKYVLNQLALSESKYQKKAKVLLEKLN